MQTATTKFSFSEVSILVKLAIPLVCTGFLEASVGFFSTFFLAQLGAKELAAGAVVQWLFFTMMVILWGTLCSVSILVAQKHGAKDDKGISEILRDSLLLSLLFVVPSVLILRNIGAILLFTGQDPTTVELAKTYMYGLSWGLLPDFIGLVLMQFLIGLGHTRTSMLFTLLWVPLNIFFNYALIFGKFGLPALGMAGIGWGTTLAYWLLAILVMLYLFVNKNYRKYLKYVFVLRKPKFLAELCQVGFPMGFMYCIEIAFFLTLTLLMGHLGTQILAANQITLQFLGQVSVISFSIAQAVTVRLGHNIGAGKIYLAVRATYIGVTIAALVMLIISLCYWFIPEKLIAIDIDPSIIKNADVIHYAVQFLGICALFQLLEAIRLTLFGALRGMKDTKFTLLTSGISFWGISLPLGYFLAQQLDWQGSGFWWGTVIGQLCAVILLMYRFRYKMRLAYKRNPLILQE